MTPHEKKRAEIALEQNCNKIAAHLIRMQTRVVDGQIEFVKEFQLGLSKGNISMHSCVDYNDVGCALLAMISMKWAERIGSRYSITWFGIESYYQDTRNPTINTGAADLAFKDEALTGGREGRSEHGNTTLIQSSLEWAALPGPEGKHRHENTVERDQMRACFRNERVREIARENSVSEDECRAMLESGEIHRCSHCGKYEKHHPDNRPGHKWQAPSIACRKERRK